ncbi:uroporphyrinogen decarboxylase family protein [Haloimpatiens sp. FM7330]|uniref:uroporphyrinogen decarboxylase family protein n=1 Tax=Haloimpatiens sp. FM7330 TaxID=3298610 RepID=UPI00362F4FF5
MNGKERVLKALSFEEVDRTPWMPYAGVQTANFLNIDAEQYLKSADNIVNGILKAYEVYKPDGLPVAFDLQIEAEALGCELRWADNNPPAVVKHILEEKTIDDIKYPTENDGRYPIVLEAARKLSEAIGDKVALYALICGPFTLASHLMGTNLFMDMIMEPDKVHKVMKFTTKVAKDFSTMYSKTGVHIIAAVDPMTTQISPEHFEEFVSPYLTELNTYVKELGLKVTTFCCGDATKSFELMCKTKPNGIAFDENVDLKFARQLGTKYKVSLGGNLPLTTTMLFGSPLENVQEAKKEIEIASNEPGFILSPGCDMPFDTPIENIKAISQFVRGEFSSIEMFTSERQLDDDKDEVFEDVAIEKGKAFIEIVTLDSEGCAPCQYMVESVKKVAPQYGDKLRWRETLIKSKAGIKRTMELGVKNLPALLINNEIVFDNIVPDENSLKVEIDKRL